MPHDARMSIRSRVKDDFDDFRSGLRGEGVVSKPGSADIDSRSDEISNRAVVWTTMTVIHLSLPLLFGFLLARPGVPFVPWGDAPALAVTLGVAAVGIGSRAVPKRSLAQWSLVAAAAGGVALILRSAATPTSIVAVGSTTMSMIGLLRSIPLLYALVPVAALAGLVVPLGGDGGSTSELFLSGRPWTGHDAGHELILLMAMLTVASLIDLSGRMLAQQAKRTEAAEEARDRAIGDERARIARELHDVVSHHVTAMTLQAEAAIVTGDRDALRAVSTSGREALAELRRMLGVLRYSREADVPGHAALTPQPDLSRLELLADRAATSLQVDIVRTGEVVPLAAGVELCAYRIVQEAVTNVGKHSDATHAVVTLAYGPTQLAVEVRDDGRPLSAGRFEGSGHGLVGMAERVALLNGELDTGPMPGGGFRVHARLPVGG
jgi:signal transduction histidine kinase